MINDNNIKKIFGINKEDDISVIKPIIINVPDNIDFISGWKDFSLPQGHCIIDKTICGCGFTEYCLENNIPTILCAPRKILLENKEEQHNKPGSGLTPVYYFKNESESGVNYDGAVIDKDQGLIDCSIEVDNVPDDYRKFIMGLKLGLENYLQTTQTTPKILVTYDSLHYIVEVLGDRISEFSIIIDEFQSLFTDAVFKPEVEISLVEEVLINLPNVVYLSATPMLDRYLSLVDYFKNLPYYKLVWPENKIQHVKIKRKRVDSIVSACSDIVTRYKSGNFEKRLDKNGNTVESNEVVFFVNSVKTICNIISKNKLKPEECNILCAKSKKNSAKLKRLGKLFGYGVVPLKGEKHKMFTFCTRTTYIGADFYSPCATTVICSDINIDSLNLDIALDLPQILGRQRLPENVFKNTVIYLYRAKKGEETISEDEFMDHISRKLMDTDNLLDLYSSGSDDLRGGLERNIKTGYVSSFIGVSKHTGELSKNYFMVLSECRAYEISRPEYQDEVIIKKDNSIKDMEFLEDKSTGEAINFLIDEFKKDNNFERRMRLLCDFIKKYPETYKNSLFYLSMTIPSEYFLYLDVLGPDRCKSLSYIEANLKRELDIKYSSNTLKGAIIHEFALGSRYTLKYIKEKLGDIYRNIIPGYKKSTPATLLLEVFEVKNIIIIDPNSKEHIRGYEIIGVK